MKAKVLVNFNFGYAHGIEGQEIEVNEDVFNDLSQKGFLASIEEVQAKEEAVKKVSQAQASGNEFHAANKKMK